MSSNHERVVRSLYDSVKAGDLDAFLAPWDADGVLHDPYGLPPHAGLPALRSFAQLLFTKLSGRTFHVKYLVAVGDRVAVHWVFDAAGPSGVPMSIDGLGMYYFNAAGKVVRVEEHYEPELLARLLA